MDSPCGGRAVEIAVRTDGQAALRQAAIGAAGETVQNAFLALRFDPEDGARIGGAAFIRNAVGLLHTLLSLLPPKVPHRGRVVKPVADKRACSTSCATPRGNAVLRVDEDIRRHGASALRRSTTRASIRNA
jgi:hypothetical protein